MQELSTTLRLVRSVHNDLSKECKNLKEIVIALSRTLGFYCSIPNIMESTTPYVTRNVTSVPPIVRKYEPKEQPVLGVTNTKSKPLEHDNDDDPKPVIPKRRNRKSKRSLILRLRRRLSTISRILLRKELREAQMIILAIWKDSQI